ICASQFTTTTTTHSYDRANMTTLLQGPNMGSVTYGLTSDSPYSFNALKTSPTTTAPGLTPMFQVYGDVVVSDYTAMGSTSIASLATLNEVKFLLTVDGRVKLAIPNSTSGYNYLPNAPALQVIGDVHIDPEDKKTSAVPDKYYPLLRVSGA